MAGSAKGRGRRVGWTLREHRLTGIFQVRFSWQGHRYEFGTGETDRGRAEEAAARRYAQVVSGRRAPGSLTGPRAPIEDAAGEWIASLEGTLDPLTVRQYQMYVATHWAPVFPLLADLTAASVADYRAARLRVVQRGTVKKELSALRGFVRWCAEPGRGFLPEEFLIKNPPEKATGARDERRNPKPEPQVLTAAQVERVIAALPVWSTGNANVTRRFRVRDRFRVAWETALRPSTLDALRAPDDYRKGAKALTIRDEADKARFGRELPLTAAARKALDRACPAAGPIFGHHDYREALKEAGAAAGLPPEVAARLSPYDFRHSRLTYLAERSGNLVGVAFLAGHKHLTTTNHYLHGSYRAAEEALRSAIGGKAGGKGGRK
jgi:integrase